MEIDEIRAMTSDELDDDLEASHKALMSLRFRVATMQLSNVSDIKKTRKRITRIKTIIRERELAKEIQ